MARPNRHDYIDKNGDLRVHRGREFDPGENVTRIGHRVPGQADYVGTSRWGRTWGEVRENTELGPMQNPPTVND